MSPLVYAAFACLLLAAAACFGLGRVAPARLLGLGAAAAALAAGALLVVAPAPDPAAAPTVLFSLGAASFSLGGGPGANERALAVTLLGGGGASLLALAGAIAPTVRGFGAIFAWSLLTLAAALLSLGAPPLSLAQPLAWAVLAVAGYAALRASGAAAADETPPLGLSIGLLASVLLAGGLLATGVGQPADGARGPFTAVAGELPPWPAALCGLLAALGLAGCPPFAGARGETVEAPAPLGALIFGLAAPAAALGWLLRSVAGLPILPSGWAITLGLIGGLGVLACGAGALGTRGLRPILAWVTAGQAAAVVAAAGLAGPLAALAGPGLLAAMMLGATVSAVAAATTARTTGGDDYTGAGAPPPPIAGAVWAVGGAVALGLPPLWGFWPRLWLLEAAQEQQPWLLAPLVSGAVLTALALFAPLARLWAGGATARAGWSDSLPALLAGLPLLILGVAPWLGWGPWLSLLPFAPGELPAAQAAQLVAALSGLVLVALLAVTLRSRPARSLERDPDEERVQLAPDALGAALRPLAWLGSPEPLLRLVWAGLQWASEAARFVMGIFEQRYYLLGVLAALLTIMLLMAQ